VNQNEYGVLKGQKTDNVLKGISVLFSKHI